MGKLEFMNQDGEWEQFPSEEDLQYLKRINETVKPSGITTHCILCNAEFDISEIVITGGSINHGFTWSCPSCHAVTQQ